MPPTYSIVIRKLEVVSHSSSNKLMYISCKLQHVCLLPLENYNNLKYLKPFISKSLMRDLNWLSKIFMHYVIEKRLKFQFAAVLY